ncbi:hypothetical protein [Micromonospora sp. NPDC047730]|uniref:hypothetical protein n=1 Tax=Micromonospora sp. NPDC047730 TaxID=3364253 RepID=UPI00371A8564
MRSLLPSGLRRGSVVLAACLPLLLLLTTTAAPAAPPAVVATAGQVTDLGPALYTVNVRNAEFGTLPDGTPVAYAISNGTPASFTVVDARDGRRITAIPLDGYTVGGWVELAADGTVYFSVRAPTPAAVFRFHPDTMRLEQLGGIAGETALYSATFDANGVLYFGTYPHAKLVSFDPATGRFRDYGSLTTDAAYVFSVGIVAGKVWAGTGPVPHLYQVDPRSGRTTEMSVPAPLLENTDWFIGIEPRDDLVFVRLSPRGTYDMAVYDLKRERWLDQVIGNTFGAEPTAQGRDGIFYLMAGGTLTGYQVPARRSVSTGFEDSALPAQLADAVGTYGMSLVDLREPLFPGETVAGIDTDGRLWHYNLATRRSRIVPADVLGSPAGAHSMGVGPDGTVYLGAYLSSGVMSRIDQESQQVEQIRGPKQADAIVSHNGTIAVSSYPGAVVHTGDPAQPWAWGTNPRKVLELGRGEPHFQDRIFAMTSAGERLAVGSVPDYGQLGGALTLVDPATGAAEVHRDVVDDQSVVSLAYRDGVVYGGTSIHGGLSSEPTQDQARLFAWDVGAGRLAWSDVVVPGATVIHELEFGPDGLLWGMADDGTVFAYDPGQRKVLRSVATGLRNTNTWGRVSSLYHRPADGLFYGNAGGRLFRFDPGTLAIEVLVETGVRESAMDGQGRIYLADATHVYRFDPATTHQ